jgi:N-acetylgalactosamine kinase
MPNLPDLIREFETRFGAKPTHHVISPGRVNLIGEHTDYNMLPVLPMAINHGLHLLVRASDSARVRVQNTSTRYPGFEFTGEAEIPKSPMGDSSNYVKAAVQHAWPIFAQMRGTEPRGFDALIDSDLPPAAGLSSSSATVVGAYLALCAANDVRMMPGEEPEAMRLAERYVGTASGGMDQATILLGGEGKALLINFDPVRTTEVSLPADVVFFAVDSLQRAAKSGGARFEYNRRTFECLSSVQLMQRYIEDHAKDGTVPERMLQSAPDWQHLRDVYDAYEGDLDDALRLLRNAMHEKPYSLLELRAQLGTATDELLHARLLPPADDATWSQFEGFLPLQRAEHVLGEAQRVHRCAAAFNTGDVSAAAELISASHISCRDLYHISTPQMEKLVAAAQHCGALAARITGAGFGGSIVAMVRRQEAAQFRDWLWKQYYGTLTEQELRGATADNCILECRPSAGARIEVLE